MLGAFQDNQLEVFSEFVDMLLKTISQASLCTLFHATVYTLL